MSVRRAIPAVLLLVALAASLHGCGVDRTGWRRVELGHLSIEVPPGYEFYPYAEGIRYGAPAGDLRYQAWTIAEGEGLLGRIPAELASRRHRLPIEHGTGWYVVMDHRALQSGRMGPNVLVLQAERPEGGGAHLTIFPTGTRAPVTVPVAEAIARSARWRSKSREPEDTDSSAMAGPVDSIVFDERQHLVYWNGERLRSPLRLDDLRQRDADAAAAARADTSLSPAARAMFERDYGQIAFVREVRAHGGSLISGVNAYGDSLATYPGRLVQLHRDTREDPSYAWDDPRFLRRIVNPLLVDTTHAMTVTDTSASFTATSGRDAIVRLEWWRGRPMSFSEVKPPWPNRAWARSRREFAELLYRLLGRPGGNVFWNRGSVFLRGGDPDSLEARIRWGIGVSVDSVSTAGAAASLGFSMNEWQPIVLANRGPQRRRSGRDTARPRRLPWTSFKPPG